MPFLQEPGSDRDAQPRVSTLSAGTATPRRQQSTDEKWIFIWKVYLGVRLVGSFLLGSLYKYYLYTYLTVALGSSDFGGNKLLFVYDAEFIAIEIFQVYLARHSMQNAGLLNLILYWVCGLLPTIYATVAPLTVMVMQNCVNSLKDMIQTFQNETMITEKFFSDYGLWYCPLPSQLYLNQSLEIYMPKFGHKIPILANVQNEIVLGQLTDPSLPGWLARSNGLGFAFLGFVIFMQFSVVYILYQIRTQYQILLLHRHGADVRYINAKARFNVISLTRKFCLVMTGLLFFQLAGCFYIQRSSGLLSDLSADDFEVYTDQKRYILDAVAIVIQLIASGVWVVDVQDAQSPFWIRYRMPIRFGLSVMEIVVATLHIWQILVYEVYEPALSSLVTYYAIHVTVSLVSVILIGTMVFRNDYKLISQRSTAKVMPKSRSKKRVHPDMRMEID